MPFGLSVIELVVVMAGFAVFAGLIAFAGWIVAETVRRFLTGLRGDA